jgi:hypothetical protein
MRASPEVIVPRGGRGRRAFLDLLRAQDGAAPSQATAVGVCHDADGLHVGFECMDRDAWASHTEHDAPLWEEEVVEIFLAAGEADPRRYFEIEVNPLGAVFDAHVENPNGERGSMRVDRAWDPPGLAVAVVRDASSWRVDISIPWRAVCAGPPPRVWRANFFRIDRPKDSPHEFTCWSPTFVDPPDFHKPARFGRLLLEESSG